MQDYRLSFGVIRVYNDHLAEVMVDEGIEMSLAQVGEYHDFLLEHLKPHSYLLVNKSNSYTYSFDAQQHIFIREHIAAYAMFTPTVSSRLATDSVVMIQKHRDTLNVKLFDDRDEAMRWLVDQMKDNVTSEK